MKNLNRRDFLQHAGILLTATGVAGSAVALEKYDAKPLNVGIIGTGSRGTGLADVISGLDEISFIAGCDVLDFRLEEAMKLADKKAKAYDDYRRLLDDKKVEAVIISTPLYLHTQMVSDALEAGKHIYCEKTMAYDVEQTLETVRKVKASDRIFQVGHQYRSYPLYHAVKEIIDDGYIGDFKHFICHYNMNSSWRRALPSPDLEKQINWRMYREFSGGPLAELSSHQVDIINWMTGSHLEKITGIGSINYWKDGREVFDNINLVAEYTDNITGMISCHLSNSHQAYVIKIIGSDGLVEIFRDKAFFYKEPGSQASTPGFVDGVAGATMKLESGDPLRIPVELKRGYSATTYALQDFARCVREGKKPASNIDTGRDAAIAVALGNQAMENNSTQQWKKEYSI
ncbi:MAG: Gfo/Idh/MocA family oxidoreductase [Cyclobacteriaceae bacterium]|nr:Gfo/Idh/MocA family oxidoreductase [Cyclobacteriaceae bacterium]